ncbi:MAG: amino acid permease, partial [Candidatus Latescibacteria bacterium]|nr:amino acid permease [Candidatus Latescibacterota bacterium]
PSRTSPLLRQLTLLDSIAIIVGIIIGVGIFRVPSSIATYLHSPWLILAAWIVGGLLALCGGLCYAELSASLPRTGGDYVYLRESYGRAVGFLFGWTKLLVVRPGSIAGIAYIFAGYAAYFLPMSPLSTRLVAIAAIAALTLVNLVGLRFGKSAQNILVAAKILGVLMLGIVGLGLSSGQLPSAGAIAGRADALSLPAAFGLALIFVMWTYGGWNEGTYVAEEMQNPERDLPRSIVIGILGVLVLYILLNSAYLLCIPLSEMQGSEMAASLLAERLFGALGGRLIALIVMVFALGALNGLILTGARISYALGSDHGAFGAIAWVHDRFRTPAVALLMNGAWASVLVFSGTFDRLVSYTGAVTWLFFGLTGGSLFILRRRLPDLVRPYKVWGYPAVPAIFLAVSLWLTYNTLMYSPSGAVLGVIIMLTGLPVYLLTRRKGD